MAAPTRMTATDLLIRSSGAGSPELLALPTGYYALAHTYSDSSELNLFVITRGVASNGRNLPGGFFDATPQPTSGSAYYTQPTLGLLADGRFQMQVTLTTGSSEIVTGAAFFGDGATLQDVNAVSANAHDPVITGQGEGVPVSVFIRSPTNAVPAGGGVFFAWHGVTGRPVGVPEQIDDGHPAFAPNDSNRLREPNLAMIEPDGGGLMVVWAGADGTYYLRQREVFGGWKPVQDLQLALFGEGSVALNQLADGNVLLTVAHSNVVYAIKLSPDGTFDNLNATFQGVMISMPGGHSLSNLDITALDDGRFFAVWTESFAGGGLSAVNQIRGQMFAANGTADGAALTLLSEGNFAQTPPHATVDQLADGRLAISYTTVAGALYLSLWDPRTTGMNEFGSSLAEFWEGSRFDDVARMRGGRDNFFGGLGNDTVLGGAGNDSLTGGAGNDVLSGGTGIDWMHGGAGADVVDGGQGARDFLTYFDSATGVTVRLWNGTGVRGDAQGDVISGIEHLNGSSHDDVLIGADGAVNTFYAAEGNDYLAGLGGDDWLYGNDGNDTLAGGTGADTLWGGNGSDMADYSGSAAGVTVRLWNGTGQNGDAQGDRLNEIEHVTGSALGDSLIGDDAVGNWLTGGGGGDYLGGLGGADRLNGQSGNDTLEGGNGADQFVFGLGYGHDRVVQFVDGVDKVDLVGLTFGQFAESAIAGGVRLTGTGAAAGLILDLGGVTIAQVEATDFI